MTATVPRGWKFIAAMYPAEYRLLRHRVHGYANWRIAAHYGYTEATVRTYLNRVRACRPWCVTVAELVEEAARGGVEGLDLPSSDRK